MLNEERNQYKMKMIFISLLTVAILAGYSETAEETPEQIHLMRRQQLPNPHRTLLTQKQQPKKIFPNLRQSCPMKNTKN